MSFPEMMPQTISVGPYTVTNVNANADNQAVMRFDRAGEITMVTVTDQSAVTGNDTNYGHLILYNDTQAANVAHTNFATGVNLAAATPYNLTISEGTFADADVISVRWAGGGTAVNLDCLHFTITYVYGSPAAEG